MAFCSVNENKSLCSNIIPHSCRSAVWSFYSHKLVWQVITAVTFEYRAISQGDDSWSIHIAVIAGGLTIHPIKDLQNLQQLWKQHAYNLSHLWKVPSHSSEKWQSSNNITCTWPAISWFTLIILKAAQCRGHTTCSIDWPFSSTQGPPR